MRIIVPACARCNHERGCRDLIPFLLTRPRRISCLLDYLATLSPESLREVDLRIFGELYAAIAVLQELTDLAVDWRGNRERLCSGRSLHRKRYAARRAMLIVAARMATLRERGVLDEAPGCLLPTRIEDVVPIFMEESIGRLEARLLGLLAVSWGASAELVERQMERAVAGTAIARGGIAELDHVVELEGTHEAGVGEDQVSRRRRRIRVDQRRGRTARARRSIPRGRAA